jgi:hypothetical protein
MTEFKIQDVLAAMPLMPDQWEIMKPEQREEWLAQAPRREDSTCMATTTRYPRMVKPLNKVMVRKAMSL